jgi:DNA polymerase-3 subunit gamma/tau
MASEMGFDLLDMPAPNPVAAPEIKVEAPKAEASPAPAAPAPEAAEAPAGDFQNDPLIKAAVEKFKLKLAARG